MTKFVGYKNKSGSFTNKETGELVEFDNYDLYFITGNVPDIVGYFPSSYRVKGNVIRQVIGFDVKAGDDAVLSHLHDMLNKEVLLSVLDIDDKPTVTGLYLMPQNPKNINGINSK